MDKQEVLERCRRDNVAFVRLQFTEPYGAVKNVSIPVEELEKALDNELMFDGSSIRGFKRIEQSDMYFLPDPATYALLPWRGNGDRNTARLICDVADPDGQPFAGDPRSNLKRVLKQAEDMGYTMQVGPGGRVLPVPAGRGRQSDRRSARRRDVLRRGADRQGRGLPPRHRADPAADGFPPRGGAPRGGDRPARDRLPPRRRAQHGRQPDHLPDGGEGDRGPARHARDVHGQAAARRERLRHARQPVAVARRRERVSGRERRPQAVDRCLQLHRRHPQAPAGDHGGGESHRQLVQAAAAGVRGAGLHRVVAGQQVGRDPGAGQARALDPDRAAHAGPHRQPVPGAGLHAAGRPGRHHQGADAAGAGQPQHL